MLNIFYTDGATRNNGQFGKQESHIAVVHNTDLIIHEHIGDKTNNEAEALALIAAFSHIKQKKLKNTIIITDSKFWYDTITKYWRLQVERLFPLRDQLQAYYRERACDLLVWKGREENLAGWFLEYKYEAEWNSWNKNRNFHRHKQKKLYGFTPPLIDKV